ncbi:PD40 domain-containing protein [Nocardioides sp. Y6]|uniref:PD40 domain-containing protein n=2 Tax=Nocardioides malaquae TaxID=2773426 RepID=A0ABR9RWT5_9ACTN|nr:PD40 domain-containing protein [Nocardioides malaquae]
MTVRTTVRARVRRSAALTAGLLLAGTMVTVAGAATTSAADGPVPVPSPTGPSLRTMVDPALSADGRLMAFGGRAGQTSGLYLHDRATSSTVRLPTTVDGEAIEGHVRQVAVNADATRIVFVAGQSPDDDLVDPTSQVWLHDRVTGTTRLVSATAAGRPGNAGSDQPSISADGRVVAFRTHATDLVAGTAGEGGDVVARELGGPVELLSGATAPGRFDPHGAWGPSLSADGRHVAFVSTQTLAPRESVGQPDAWVVDRASGDVRLASVPLDGVAGPVSEVSISGDGGRVALSRVTAQFRFFNRVGIAVHDLGSGEVVAADVEAPDNGGVLDHPRLSSDGRHVLFLDLTGSAWVRDVDLAQTRPVPLPALAEGSLLTDVALSADARVVALGVAGEQEASGQPRPSQLWSVDLGPAPTSATEGPTPGDAPSITRTQRKLSAPGYELEVQAGGWEPVLGGRVTHQWLRNGRPIRGATGRKYVLVRADMGATIRVRENLTVPGLPVSSSRSAAFAAEPSGTYVRVRVPRRLRAGKPFRVRVSVRHYEGNRPQGRLRLSVAGHVRTVRVDRDGRVAVRMPGLAAGVRVLKVRHLGTRFVLGGGTVEKSLAVGR